MGHALSADLVNFLYPVCGVRVYPNALEVIRKYDGDGSHRVNGKRSEVKSFSQKSMLNFYFKIASMDVSWKSLMTLTYGVVVPMSGREAKRDLFAFRKRFFRTFGQCRMAWFCEFQKRGALHYHILLDKPVCDQEERDRFAVMWSEVSTPYDFAYTAVKKPYIEELSRKGLFTRSAVETQHRKMEHWSNLRSVDGGVRYVSKYLGKGRQKLIPDGFQRIGRFWGFVNCPGSVCSADFYCGELEVRQLATLLGRDLSGFDVLPKYIFHSGKLPER